MAKNSYLRHMEWAISPKEFVADWPNPRFERGIWYIVPAGYTYGFGTAISPESAAWQHSHIRGSGVAAVAEIPWC